MTAAKKKEQLVNMKPPGLPMSRITINLTIKPNDKPDWIINPELYLIHSNPACSATQELILGDRIIRINGISPKTSNEGMALLTTVGSIKVVIERRKFARPVTSERLKKIGVQRMEGYAYFIVNCVNTGKNAKAIFGFTLALNKNKAHIVSVEAGSVASQHFCVGDALLDIDSIPIPFADINFLKNYSLKFFKDGQFTTVIERPVTSQRMDQYAVLYKTFLPKTDAEIVMGADAVKIGIEASLMHHLVLKKVGPKSCLTSDAANVTAKTMTAMTYEAEPERRVKMASTSVATVIGSDVKDEDDLKKVVRKSHSKDQMSLDDF